jgi:hypothetical protein
MALCAFNEEQKKNTTCIYQGNGNAELKAAKKLADDLGDYQTLGFKESLVYMPPKELF